MEVTKSIEGLEAAELTEAALTEQLYPTTADAAQPTVTAKAAPKGGRKLVKRNKPVDIE